MKKKIAIVAALATIFAAGITATTPNVEASARRVDYVGYVEETDAPVIDGVVDDVWKDASQLYTNRAGSTYGYSSVLWNEDGMYYLATVWDDSICAKDTCAFWISENYDLDNRWLEYFFSGDYGYDADGAKGAYSVQVHADGKYEVSCTKSEKYSEVKIGVKTHPQQGVWYAEIFIPHVGAKTILQKGSRVGFEFSIDGYDSILDRSASTVKWGWNFNWPYRTNYTSLGMIVLSKEGDGEYEIPDTEKDESSDDILILGDKILLAKESSGCGSTIATVGIGAALGGLLVVLKKKKD